jgi:hypothetical protein
VRGQSLNIEQHQSMAAKHLTHGQERKVAEVFMIDGIELVVLDQFQQVREFHGDDAMVAQQELKPGDEIV